MEKIEWRKSFHFPLFLFGPFIPFLHSIQEGILRMILRRQSFSSSWRNLSSVLRCSSRPGRGELEWRKFGQQDNSNRKDEGKRRRCCCRVLQERIKASYIAYATESNPGVILLWYTLLLALQFLLQCFFGALKKGTRKISTERGSVLFPVSFSLNDVLNPRICLSFSKCVYLFLAKRRRRIEDFDQISWCCSSSSPDDDDYRPPAPDVLLLPVLQSLAIMGKDWKWTCSLGEFVSSSTPSVDQWIMAILGLRSQKGLLFEVSKHDRRQTW